MQHYAPATPVALASAEEIDRRCRAVSASSATIAVLARRAPPPECAELEARGLWWRAPTEASGYARVLYAALRALDGDDVDAIVQVGTNLAAVELCAQAERWLAKPVLAINAVTYWDALRRSGIDDRMLGRGSILERF